MLMLMMTPKLFQWCYHVQKHDIIMTHSNFGWRPTKRIITS